MRALSRTKLLEIVLAKLLISITKRTNFEHLQHDTCTPEDCDVRYREIAIEDAQTILAHTSMESIIRKVNLMVD